MKKHAFLLTLLFNFFYSNICFSNEILKFEKIKSIESVLPTKSIKNILYDKEGYFWIATDKGLFRFDGYKLINFKSGLKTPDLLTSNEITCISEDKKNKLWLGTINGINILDKSNNKVFKSNNSFFKNNHVEKILITKSERIFIGTDRGFCEYFEDNDSCNIIKYDNERKTAVATTVKGLIEDSEGNIIVGSWEEGLSIYNPDTRKIINFPRIGRRNSAHTVFEDSKGRLWIGTWGEGLFMIENRDFNNKQNWKHFKRSENEDLSIIDNIIYTINEDTDSGNIWIGCRSGLSIINSQIDKINNYYPSEKKDSHIDNEINSIIKYKNEMWLGLLGGGIYRAYNNKSDFNFFTFSDKNYNLTTRKINTIWKDENGILYLGLFNNKTLAFDEKNNKSVNNIITDIFEKQILTSIYSSEKTNYKYISTFGTGIYVIDSLFNHSYNIFDNSRGLGIISNIIVDSLDQYWIAGRYAVSVNDKTLKNGTVMNFNKSEIFEFINIIIDNKNRIWCSTKKNGVIRINEPEKKLDSSLSFYNKDNNKSICNYFKNIICDEFGRIFCSTDGYGLMMFDENSDSFISINQLIDFPAEHIESVTSDLNGNLWIASNIGLIRLTLSEKIEDSSYIVFNSTYNLNEIIFTSASFYDKNEDIMYMGLNEGYLWFEPKKITSERKEIIPHITNISISGNAWENLDESIKYKISKESPGFTKQVTLPYSHRNITIEFSSLDMVNAYLGKYQYKLEGFDKTWNFTDMNNHSVNYNNLPRGTYKFHVKAIDRSTDDTSNKARTFTITVLPSPWFSHWAIMGYITISIILSLIIFKIVKNRIKLINQIRIKEIEKSQIEKLNNSKIQFFTNITHEFLTPLTVIIASINELKILESKYIKQFLIMENNANRLIRLLQQILEFRKSDTGNLKLKVEKRDIIEFLHEDYKNIIPLIKTKELDFSFTANKEVFECWFDKDKLDKIIYNLISNAVKYTNKGGYINVELNTSEDEKNILLEVKDSGIGMSQETINTIFDRFTDGEYRSQNTYGYGIGLSLTKTLVELHKGNISVNSSLGSGSTFSVKIPVSKETFDISEMNINMYDDKTESIENELKDLQDNKSANCKNILVVEDNKELLDLISRLLSCSFNVTTATDGLKAMEIIQETEIDIIISDIMMPNVDGIKFTKWLKSDINFCHIPIILLTAKCSESDRAESYDIGADGFIAKPFSNNVLLAKINNLLRTKDFFAKKFQKQLVLEMKDFNFTSMDEEFITRAANCVHENLNDSDFGQVQLSEKMAVSKSTLYRKITSLTGMNPSAFIRNIRVKAAYKIITTNSNVKIAELAYSVGFNDPKYFSTCFKKEFGILPSEFIEKRESLSLKISE